MVSAVDERVTVLVLAGCGTGTLVRVAAWDPDVSTAYLQWLDRYDPGHFLPSTQSRRLLLQHGSRDEVISREESLALRRLRADSDWREYDCGHGLETPAPRGDRRTLLVEELLRG
ncbi:hypothetical protein CLV35_3572 [Motilibacter peucedani]|uniref:Alpha/beta hydrolase family protein n=2 Tax=Motilibacter peucedani TaxID=598650 RepID=A0A420XL69_9ACTN|nr:hypothetical protein CLV35_3572 [Motilibacter peucedani]